MRAVQQGSGHTEVKDGASDSLFHPLLVFCVLELDNSDLLVRHGDCLGMASKDYGELKDCTVKFPKRLGVGVRPGKYAGPLAWDVACPDPCFPGFGRKDPWPDHLITYCAVVPDR